MRTGFGSNWSLWCGSGSWFLFYVDADLDADPDADPDPDPDADPDTDPGSKMMRIRIHTTDFVWIILERLAVRPRRSHPSPLPASSQGIYDIQQVRKTIICLKTLMYCTVRVPTLISYMVSCDFRQIQLPVEHRKKTLKFCLLIMYRTCLDILKTVQMKLKQTIKHRISLPFYVFVLFMISF